jgi:hypothetical protein
LRGILRMCDNFTSCERKQHSLALYLHVYGFFPGPLLTNCICFSVRRFFDSDIDMCVIDISLKRYLWNLVWIARHRAIPLRTINYVS